MRRLAPRLARVALPALAFASLLGARSAAAAPLHVAHMDGLRGDPLDTGAFALYWNPAGLAVPGMALGVHGTLAVRHATYDRDAALNDVAPDEAAANAGLATINTAGAIPALAFRHGLKGLLGEDVDLGYGAGVYIPFAGVADWARHPEAPAEVPGAYDGPQRWATIHSRFLVVAASAGVAAAHRPTGLSLGVAPVVYMASLSTLRARDVDRTDDLVDAAGHLKEGRILFEGDDVRLGVDVGLRWDASPAFGLAATYHAVPQFQLSGQGHVAYGTAEPFTLGATLPFPLPDFVRLAARVEVGGFTLRPTLEWADWSVMQRQVARAHEGDTRLIEIERSFADVFGARLRCDSPLLGPLRLTGGFGYDTAPTPTRTHEPGLAEGTGLTAELGVEHVTAAGTRLALGVSGVHFFERTVRDSIQKPTTNGTYTDDRLFATLDVGVAF